MSGPIEKFRAAKEALWRFDNVHSLIGKRYHGGGGGVGRVISAASTIQVYHQESDGSRNYHDIACGDSRVMEAVNTAALELAPQILARAREILAAKLQDAASQARAEAETVLAAAKGSL